MKIDVQDLLKSRLVIYQFLSKGFLLEPYPENFQGGHEYLYTLVEEMEESHEGLNLILAVLTQANELPASQWLEWQREFQRLFYGPASLPAPPWESVYRSKEHIILDEHTLAVREFYRQWGVEPQNLNREPDDHIGLELEFMWFLTQKASDALAQNDFSRLQSLIEAQVNFLDNHLLTWVNPFCSRLAEGTNHSFYKGLALFTTDYLQLDRELLGDMISPIKELGSKEVYHG